MRGRCRTHLLWLAGSQCQLLPQAEVAVSRLPISVICMASISLRVSSPLILGAAKPGRSRSSGGKW